MRRVNWKEGVGVLAVVLVIVGLPLGLWYWRAEVVPSRHPSGTKFFHLTAVADGGIWTEEEVVGYNYWLGSPKRVEKIELEQGDHVVLRLSSADVLHTFAIPILRLGPVDVPAGHTVEVEFDAERTGRLTFLCWQMCSPEHPKLKGRFLVEGGEEEEEGW